MREATRCSRQAARCGRTTALKGAGCRRALQRPHAILRTRSQSWKRRRVILVSLALVGIRFSCILLRKRTTETDSGRERKTQRQTERKRERVRLDTVSARRAGGLHQEGVAGGLRQVPRLRRRHRLRGPRRLLGGLRPPGVRERGRERERERERERGRGFGRQVCSRLPCISALYIRMYLLCISAYICFIDPCIFALHIRVYLLYIPVSICFIPHAHLSPRLLGGLGHEVPARPVGKREGREMLDWVCALIDSAP
jgi:hypothetical protein